MCPCTAATEVGRCFKMLVFSPGHVLKYFFNGFSNIERTGEKTCYTEILYKLHVRFFV